MRIHTGTLTDERKLHIMKMTESEGKPQCGFLIYTLYELHETKIARVLVTPFSKLKEITLLEVRYLSSGDHCVKVFVFQIISLHVRPYLKLTITLLQLDPNISRSKSKKQQLTTVSTCYFVISYVINLMRINTFIYRRCRLFA